MKKQMVISFVVIAVVASFVFIFLEYPERDQMYSETGQVIVNGNLEMDGGYINVSPREAWEMINTNPELIVLDVSSGYDEGHIPGAINYYVGNSSFERAILELNPLNEYLVYCHFESASRLGAQKLVDANFEEVYRLDGGYGAWVDAGYAVEY